MGDTNRFVAEKQIKNKTEKIIFGETFYAYQHLFSVRKINDKIQMICSLSRYGILLVFIQYVSQQRITSFINVCTYEISVS